MSRLATGDPRALLWRLTPVSACHTCVFAIMALQVLQEVVDDWHRNDVADVLPTGQALEGNANLQHARQKAKRHRKCS